MEEQSIRKYTPQYKTKVVMEVLKGDKPLREVAEKNDLNPNVLSQWKCEFMKKSPSIFDTQQTVRRKSSDKPFVTDEYMRKIRELRIENNMSQEQVAQYLGTSQTMYARYENGMSKLPIRHLMMLVQLYDVSADYILGFSTQKSTQI